jgi:hypothetical protein
VRKHLQACGLDRGEWLEFAAGIIPPPVFSGLIAAYAVNIVLIVIFAMALRRT